VLHKSWEISADRENMRNNLSFWCDFKFCTEIE
jgi:hypothetical protein